MVVNERPYSSFLLFIMTTPDQSPEALSPRSFEELPPESPLKQSLTAYFARMGQPGLETTEELLLEASEEVRTTVRSALTAVRTAEHGASSTYDCTDKRQRQFLLKPDFQAVAANEEETYGLPFGEFLLTRHMRKRPTIGRIAVNKPGEQGTAIGHLIFDTQGKIVRLLTVAVRRSWRGRGIAEQLVAERIQGLASGAREPKTVLTTSIEECHRLSPAFLPDLLAKLQRASDPEQIVLLQTRLSEVLRLFDGRSPLKAELQHALSPLLAAPPEELLSARKQELLNTTEMVYGLMQCIALIVSEDPFGPGNAGRDPTDGLLILQHGKTEDGQRPPTYHITAKNRKNEDEGYATYRIDPDKRSLILHRFITLRPHEEGGIGVELAAALLRVLREANLSCVEFRLNKF